MSNKNRTIMNCILSSFVSVLFLYFCSVSFLQHVISNIFGSTNLPSYVLSIFIFFLFLLLLGKLNISYFTIPIRIIFLFSSAFLLLSLGFENRSVYFPTIELTIPTGIFITIVTISFIIFCILISNKKNPSWILKIREKVPYRTVKILIFLTAILLICISAYNQYNMDFFTYFDYYHLHSYFNSISNLFWGQPYTETVTSIYGHYAFFYYPFLKIIYHLGIHNIYKTYMVISSALIVITLLIWIKILCWNIKNTFVLLAGIFVVCHINAARLVYLTHQLYPHRSFPVAVTALMIALWYRSSNKKRTLISILGYFISMLLIIWSAEFGIFSLISWSSLHICSAFQIKEKKTIWIILLHIIAIPIFFFGSIGLCGAINVLFGGKMMSISEFLFPLLVKEHMIEFHEQSLPSYPSAWMSITFFLLCFLGYGLKDTFLYSVNCKQNDQTAACFSISVLGLGTMTYPINRPTYIDFYLILPLAGLFISVLADSFFTDIPVTFRKITNKNKGQVLRGSFSTLSLFVLVYLMISTIINIPYKLNEYIPYKNTQKIDDAVNWITNQENNQNALSMGNITNFLYAYLGRDPGFYHMDTSNVHINPASKNEIIEKAKYLEGRSVFVSNDINYDLPKEFTDTHWEFSMYKNEDTSIYYWIPRN